MCSSQTSTEVDDHNTTILGSYALLQSLRLVPCPLVWQGEDTAVTNFYIKKYVNDMIDEGMSLSKGSSAVINYKHHLFTNYGVGETCVDLNCENCSGQNKNTFVLQTIHKLHHSLDLHFLITGHIKFAPTDASASSSSASERPL